MKAKFDIKDLLPIGFTFIVLGIGLAYGLNVMEDVESDMTAGTDAALAVSNATEGVAAIPEKLPLLATVVIAAVIISVLVRYLWVRFA